MEVVKLTKAEQEMIRLKREEEQIQKEKEALKEQLEYDKLLHEQDKSIKEQIKLQLEQNARTEAAYDILKEFDFDSDVVWLVKGVTKVKFKSYWNIEKLKVDDRKTEEVEVVSIKTKYGNIHSITPSLTADMPSGIKSQFRSYKMSTIAKKIKDKLQEEKNDKEYELRLEKSKNELIKEFTDNSPKGTTIEYKAETEWGRNRNYKVNYLNILYPNKSWVKIKFYADKSWSIVSKFDSKYIKPETKEEWLEYLQK
jgi:hypothetical protein